MGRTPALFFVCTDALRVEGSAWPGFSEIPGMYLMFMVFYQGPSI